MTKLSPRELRFMGLMYPEGTIAVGLTIGYELWRRGYLQIGKRERYELSRKGVIAVAAHSAKPSQSAPDATV